jgi:hypothetical protein
MAHPHNIIAAPSFNGRTADSGSAYRGSNPWGAANKIKVFLNIRENTASCVRIVSVFAQLLIALVRPRTRFRETAAPTRPRALTPNRAMPRTGNLWVTWCSALGWAEEAVGFATG